MFSGAQRFGHSGTKPFCITLHVFIHNSVFGPDPHAQIVWYMVCALLAMNVKLCISSWKYTRLLVLCGLTVAVLHLLHVLPRECTRKARSRWGPDYVPPSPLRALRHYSAKQHIRCSDMRMYVKHLVSDNIMHMSWVLYLASSPPSSGKYNCRYMAAHNWQFMQQRIRRCNSMQCSGYISGLESGPSPIQYDLAVVTS